MLSVFFNRDLRLLLMVLGNCEKKRHTEWQSVYLITLDTASAQSCWFSQSVIAWKNFKK